MTIYSKGIDSLKLVFSYLYSLSLYHIMNRSLKKYPCVERVNKDIGRFTMVSHKTAPRNPERLNILHLKKRTKINFYN